jgi:hypothetical protein
MLGNEDRLVSTGLSPIIGLDAALRPFEGAAKAAFEKIWRIVA